jgi:hypothetical protein
VDPDPFFYIVITVYHLLTLFIFLQTTIFFHSIHLILCLQQTGEIDNLTVSWDKVLACVLCRFHVATGAKLLPGRGTIHILSGAVAKLAGINLLKFDSFSYWFDKPRSHTKLRLAAVLIITFSWGFQLGGHLQNSYINTAPSTSFLAPLSGIKRISARGVSHFQSFTLLLFCFTLFLLASFLSKIQKNLVSLIVGIPLLLLLVHYVIP